MANYSAVDAIKDALRGDLKVSDKPKSEQRYTICQSCPDFQATLTCRLCGCFMPAKVKLEQATCPAGKW